MLTLATSGIEGTDYRRIPSDKNAPSPRHSHTAAVIDGHIYVYGGTQESGEPLSENATVWSFDTTVNSWTKIEPDQDSEFPSDRYSHASTATDQPRKSTRRTDEGTMPQLPPDPARDDMLPEPEIGPTYGTLIVHGGRGTNSKPLADVFSFDIGAKTWTALPDPPIFAGLSMSPTLALIGERLYSYAAGQTHFMDLTKTTFSDKGGLGKLGLTSLGPWTTLPSDSERRGPPQRSAAAFVPVTTGQGRHYLLLLGGVSSESPHQGHQTEQLQDIWVLQLKSEGMTAASFKDAARAAIGVSTRENKWSEARYYGPEDVLFQEGQPGRGIGDRKEFAVARDSDVDGSSVLVWGGQMADGRIRGDGLMVTISI